MSVCLCVCCKVLLQIFLVLCRKHRFKSMDFPLGEFQAKCSLIPTGSSKTFVVANATKSRSRGSFKGLDLFFGFFERVNCYPLFVRHCFVQKAREKVTNIFHKRTEVLCHTLLPVLHFRRRYFWGV